VHGTMILCGPPCDVYCAVQVGESWREMREFVHRGQGWREVIVSPLPGMRNVQA
jgi:hypothetical protein